MCTGEKRKAGFSNWNCVTVCLQTCKQWNVLVSRFWDDSLSSFCHRWRWQFPQSLGMTRRHASMQVAASNAMCLFCPKIMQGKWRGVIFSFAGPTKGDRAWRTDCVSHWDGGHRQELISGQGPEQKSHEKSQMVRLGHWDPMRSSDPTSEANEWEARESSANEWCRHVVLAVCQKHAMEHTSEEDICTVLAVIISKDVELRRWGSWLWGTILSMNK